MKQKLIFILPIFMAFIKIVAQQPYFIPSNSNIPVSATGINSMDVESGDIDNDGDLDIIIAAEYNRNLLFFNDGSGSFTEDPARLFPKKNPSNPFPGEDSEDVAIADFDNDGDLDVLFVSEDTSFHVLLINNGNGVFTFGSFDFTTSLGNAVAVLDLNNDNFLDIIIGNTGQNDVYINNQDLTFTQENNRWPTNNEGTQDLKLVDIDNDGDLDIVEGIDLGSNNLLINTNGFFTEDNNRLPDTGLVLETRKISLGDVNGDTFPDLFVSTVNFIGNASLQNRLYINDGTGFFNDATDSNLPTYTENTLDAIFIDYDFDGDLDLLTTDFQNTSGINYHSFENNSGVFSESTETVFESFTYTQGVTLYTADFNLDTFPDLYFGNYQETDNFLMYDPTALGVENVSLKNEFIIYPNPFYNELVIAFSVPTDMESFQIELYDVYGKLIKIIPFEGIGGANQKFSIDGSTLDSGIYLLKINGTLYEYHKILKY